MQLVETTLRPARIAWILPLNPSARAANRTFRLATSRWGGRYDIILQRGADAPLTTFAASALELADVDYILSVDRALGRHDWQDELDRLRIQPFEVAHLPASEEGEGDWGSILGARPTVGDADEPAACRAETGSDFDWRRATRLGLIAAQDRYFKAVGGDKSLPTALEASAEGLTQRLTFGRWMLIGDPTLELACRYWTLRALGARMTWRKLSLIAPDTQLSNRDRLLLSLSDVSAPSLSPETLTERLLAIGIRRPRVGVDDLRKHPRGQAASASFATQALALSPHRDRLHFTLPVPDTKGRPLAPTVVGVVEHRLRSLDPMSPDGIILDTDSTSRQLLRREERRFDFRVTHRGLAAAQRLGDVSLQSLPVIGYREAVAAPLESAGYEVELSDKGRFQTKMLEQAEGLRFLAWVLCENESRHLLTIFDEHHIPDEKMKDSYRRSVTYYELQERLYQLLRGDGGRLSKPRREQADAWLKAWADQLLERGMLVGGFHLKCPECLFGTFYAAERTNAHFTCDRCAATSVVPGEAERRLRPGELLHTLRTQHGDVVTLVLAWLRGQARESLLYLPEVDLFRGGAKVEADFAALVDGRLAIGEAKSRYEISKREVNKLAAAARRARASRLIFATLDKDRPACGTSQCLGCQEEGHPHPDHVWSNATRGHIRAARNDLRRASIEVLTLRIDELLDEPARRLGELAESARAFDTPREG